MLMHAIATKLLDRHVSRRLVRVIPHPGVRAAASLALSFMIPLVVEQVLARRKAGKSRRFALRGVAKAA